MSNQEPATSTGSVKVTSIVASRGALVPFVRGSVLNTSGPSSTMGAVRLGAGAPAAKSLPLMFGVDTSVAEHGISPSYCSGRGGSPPPPPGNQRSRSRQSPSRLAPLFVQLLVSPSKPSTRAIFPARPDSNVPSRRPVPLAGQGRTVASPSTPARPGRHFHQGRLFRRVAACSHPRHCPLPMHTAATSHRGPLWSCRG